MPDHTHVGRRYGPARHVVDAGEAERFRRALGALPSSDGAVPPTYSSVYCLLPVLGRVLADPDLGLRLDGLIHSEQRFEWHLAVRVGDAVDAWGVIASVSERRGMIFVGLDMRAATPEDVTVCTGGSVLILRKDG